MSRTKKLLLASILFIAIALFIFAVTLDLSRFLGFYNFYNSYPNNLIKRISVILAAVLVWLAGNSSLSQEDNKLMKYVFVVIFIGEVFFLLAEPAFAIGTFAICQCLLIVRHSKGILPKLIKASSRQKTMLAILGVVLASTIISTFILIYPAQEHRILGIIAVSYWIILSISLWSALANNNLSLFPKANSRMIAIGMVCFYFCDICVGLDTVLTGGMPWMLANSLIWIFYTPAITLLALSCYKYEPRAQLINNIKIDTARALK